MFITGCVCMRSFGLDVSRAVVDNCDEEDFIKMIMDAEALLGPDQISMLKEMYPYPTGISSKKLQSDQTHDVFVVGVAGCLRGCEPLQQVIHGPRHASVSKIRRKLPLSRLLASSFHAPQHNLYYIIVIFSMSLHLHSLTL